MSFWLTRNKKHVSIWWTRIKINSFSGLERDIYSVEKKRMSLKILQLNRALLQYFLSYTFPVSLKENI